MLLIKNKKALFNNELVEKFLAGIVLKGYEVKAIREKNVSFEGAYIKFDEQDNLVITGMHIGAYSKQSQDQDKINTKTDRKLLLNKHEITKISNELKQKGKTAVPLALLLRNNMIKLELAIVKGKRNYEKKAVAKAKQEEKDLEKFTKEVEKTKGMTWI